MPDGTATALAASNDQARRPLPQTPTQVLTFSKPSDAGREEHCNALLSLQVAVACVCGSVSERVATKIAPMGPHGACLTSK